MVPAFTPSKLPQLLISLFIFFSMPVLLSPIQSESLPPDCGANANAAPISQHLESLAPYDWVKQAPLISHALGGIGGFPGTNSREALEQAYGCGHRVFETDLSVTSDGHLVLRHDWEAGTYPVLGQAVQADNEPLTLEKFEALPIQGHYSPVTFKELLVFMAAHPDMLLVTDTKEDDGAKAAAIFKRIVAETKSVDPSLLGRLIPQLYQANNYEAVNGVYPFKQYMYTLYMNKDTDEQIVRDVAAMGIRIVVMDENRYSPEFVQALKREGVYTYVNTINDIGRIEELRRDGVQGVMTDFIMPQQLPR
ncbi:phosphatidylinositol-specific phospholipase C/glycerophosphodiester phosphodiesterase family protein [Paenibacillus sacheonensis]|uniref:GP-PDE domain-containing protein n=1 Tax=Paenibacillus sacheonensis TaxID=742054 RepID=A0A7X5BUL1_9BACL|nr:phosphatidylinositol-specific phospholipase C/glycerophosphodiester phosphodiesterase family protein [Paenibacillus sacheonensis]MBM7564187.1 glycerophosphoryl diester phosphodiesterase [Paenibacillus sacheonensis]NBC67488.1 hypothetical protein [Paenibacillus sacheonensis]